MDKHQKVSISIKNQKVYKILGSQISNQNNTLAVPNDFEILVSSLKIELLKSI